MKMFLIADHTDTFTGMRLAGVDGVIVHDKKAFLEAFNKATGDPELGILLITDSLFNENSAEILEKKMHLRTPLILSIPDRGAPANVTNAISSYIGEAIGVKL